ncbi:class I SAM-dependent methyltransferase [Marinobacter panjinensis]|uniref:Class I SAM-dependent methyltransferase n=1 Tax=Marinobacter panjinensis TaxID=2576384 RepID=A0A4U6R697_9GAMM|nr:class I SAM-dependent methyltransferase [Marinobacter panjinensis]TKV69280.1 class I SAM-dependent methyltransferase [Marinobacter panjinensis]
MKDSKTFWDKTARRYAKSPVRDVDTYQKKLAITQGYFRPDWSVLEFGCGTGSTALTHAPYVKEILATDISGKMLDIAAQKARDAGVENVRFQQGTLESLELEPESFDAVLGLNILHLLENAEVAVSRVYEVLRPGGIFVSSTALVADLLVLWRLLIPAMQMVGLAPFVNRFNRDTLVSMLTNAGFSIEYEWQPNKTSVFLVARK